MVDSRPLSSSIPIGRLDPFRSGNIEVLDHLLQRLPVLVSAIGDVRSVEDSTIPQPVCRLLSHMVAIYDATFAVGRRQPEAYPPVSEPEMPTDFFPQWPAIRGAAQYQMDPAETERELSQVKRFLVTLRTNSCTFFANPLAAAATAGGNDWNYRMIFDTVRTRGY